MCLCQSAATQCVQLMMSSGVPRWRGLLLPGGGHSPQTHKIQFNWTLVICVCVCVSQLLRPHRVWDVTFEVYYGFLNFL